jgi:hypothetical protein
MPELKLQTYTDYPKERADALHSNDEMVCFFCKKPAAEINDTLEGHDVNCVWRKKKEAAGN